ncbi:MAG: hypothetical protein DRQ63_09155 [Gammaproteobacteria bacterium]|nr:MAG: hypothetical protein DRQ63_09155 [Gammaproteobacteria bacterium]
MSPRTLLYLQTNLIVAHRSADGFMRTVDKGDYETAAQYLDLRNLRGTTSELTGAQLARRFS